MLVHQPMVGLEHVVLVRARSWICALPVLNVVETMRALPIQPVRGAPSFVRGVAVIRGAPLPVVELAAFLEAGDSAGSGRRFVTLRADARQFALSVDEVMGVSQLNPSLLERTPPLFDKSITEHVDQLGSLDRHAFALLSAVRLLPDDAWLAS